MLKNYINKGLLKKEYEICCSNCFRQLEIVDAEEDSIIKECIYCENGLDGEGSFIVLRGIEL